MEKVVLENGLTLLIHESRAHPLVTFDIWVNVGSADEPPELNGVSHFLEHMLFKGTANYGPGEIDRAVEQLGGVWNAGTAKDFTHYYLTVGSEYFYDGLAVFAEAITSSTLSEQEMSRERGVIVEEYHRKQDNPAALLYDELHRHSFSQGPYRASVLGSLETISELSHAQLTDYYQRYYAPASMVLVIAGDISSAQATDAAREAFADFTRPRRPLATKPPATKRVDRNRTSIEKDVQEAYVALSWPAPGFQNQDDLYAMDLLAVILGDGRVSRLYRNIRERQQLATTLHCSFPTAKHPALLTVTATTAPEKAAALIPAIEAEIKRLRNRPVSRAELARAKKKTINEHYFATETTRGIAGLLGYYYTISGDEVFEQTYLKRLAKVTAADIRRVARQYLDPARVTILEIVPRRQSSER